MKIGLVEQVRKADALSIQYGIDGIALMKNAARAVCDVILSKQTPSMDSICILCGNGNNAGDGFALATMLTAHFKNVSVLLLCGKAFSKDAAYYYDRLSSKVLVTDAWIESDVYVDAVFGTGFHGSLPSNVKDAFERDNFQNKLCVAIDVPSGLCGDGNIAADGTFVADVTVTFEILKKCHLQCPEYCGEIVVKDIGLSPKALSEIAFCAEILEAVQLPKTNPKSHKGSVGTLFSVVGSKLYQGAAALSVNASLRCGCGINMAFVPNSIYTPMACKTSSAIIMPCPENESGQLSFEMIDIISKQIYKRKPTAILAGSGMGLGDDTNAIIDFVLNAEIPCVIDGDGLRSLCLEQLKCRTYETVLTPHIGEFAAICGCSVSEVVEKRFELAHDFAYAYKTVLVLKDYITLISLPDGRQFVLNAPNPGLAKGGSGDVLAGMIASFLSQGFDAELSAKAGVWYHSAAGKWTAECLGERYMLPEDLISSLSKVL